jgi:type I restriction enzyme M protein
VLFVDYIAEHLTQDGRAAVIVPEGIIFQSGNAYKQLRKMLVEKYLVGVISLPAGVFQPYSGVKTSILWLDKTMAKKTNKILFVKIENDGFDLGAQRRAVKGNDLPIALKRISDWQDKIILAKQANFKPEKNISLVARDVISDNGDYNLTGERYKEQPITFAKNEFIRMGDCFQTSSGGTPLKTVKEYWENGTIPWLKSGEVGQGFIYKSEECITEKALASSSAKMFPVNTVLVAMYGATTGQVGLLKFEASTNQAVCGILPNEKIVPEFLYYLLKERRDFLVSLSVGGAQPNISQAIIKDLRIPLPLVSVQEEIVAEVESYQKIIDGARQVVENYKPRIEINPAWEIVVLGEIAEFKNGLNYQRGESGEKLEIIGVRHFQDNLYAPIHDLDDVQLDNEISQDYLLHEGDLLFVRSNGNQKLVGRSILIPPIDQRITFSGFTIRCRFTAEVSPLFYAYLFKTQSFRKILMNVGRGANIRNLTQGILSKIEVHKPGINIQLEMVSKLEKERELIFSTNSLIDLYEQKIKDRIAKVWGGPSVKNLPGGQI